MPSLSSDIFFDKVPEGPQGIFSTLPQVLFINLLQSIKRHKFAYR